MTSTKKILENKKSKSGLRNSIRFEQLQQQQKNPKLQH